MEKPQLQTGAFFVSDRSEGEPNTEDVLRAPRVTNTGGLFHVSRYDHKASLLN